MNELNNEESISERPEIIPLRQIIFKNPNKKHPLLRSPAVFSGHTDT